MMAFQFPPASRYAQTGSATFEPRPGVTIVYLMRRFVPPPERFALLQEHTVTQGERLDNVAAAYLGDPELFWRVCDANRAIRPDDLMRVGAVLRLTLPEGIPGVPDA